MRAALWQVLLLLLPQPLLTLAYLRAVRADLLPPSFAPVVALGLLPLAALVLTATGWPAAASRGWRLVLIAVGALELAWAMLAAAIVGFAIGWHSG